MSIALKYTTLKDANIPLTHFRAEKKNRIWRGHGKTLAIISMTVLAAVLPLVLLLALVTPRGNQTAFVEQYASSPIPAPVVNDYLTAQR